MKRKLFFLLEKLEIKRSERIAISILLILLVFLSGVLAMNEPEARYSEDKYEELVHLFKVKSKQIEETQDQIMARYEPTRKVTVSMTVKEEAETELNLPDTTKEEESTEEVPKIININTATNERLQELPGVGPAYAERIVTWREKNGAFISKDQLLEINGIGKKRLADIKPHITL